MTIVILVITIILSSALSLIGGAILLRTKKTRQAALLMTMPFAAGALLAAAFFDLLPEAFEMADPRTMMLYTLGGFVAFFVFERCASWFHHHHEHDGKSQDVTQRRLIVLGDVAHNTIDGLAIGAAFLVSVPTGIITALAVAAHEVPKELGTFALLLSRGWKDRLVLLANVLTAIATLVAALLVYGVGLNVEAFVAPLLAVTAGFFIYIAASDIIPDIHEQPRKIGTIQAGMLVLGIIAVGVVMQLLHDLH